MGKRPRLKFFGVEATRKELLIIADDLTYTSNPATDKWNGGRLYKKAGDKYRGCSDDILGLMRVHGFITFRKGIGDCWTELAVRYIAAVMRNNPRLRLNDTWQFEKRQRKRMDAQRKRKERELVTIPPFNH